MVDVYQLLGEKYCFYLEINSNQIKTPSKAEREVDEFRFRGFMSKFSDIAARHEIYRKHILIYSCVT